MLAHPQQERRRPRHPQTAACWERARRHQGEHHRVQGPQEQVEERVHGALASAWHVAVLAGPDTGWVSAVHPSGLTLGRGGPREGATPQPRARMTLGDPLVSREHCALRVRRGQVEVRDLCSANGTRLLPGTRWWPPRVSGQRRVTHRWRRIGNTGRLRLGSSVVEIRRRPEELRAPQAPESRPPRRRDWLRIAMPLVMCLVMVPLLLSVSASWWRWFILAMPLAMLTSAFLSGRTPRAEPMPDPATVLLLAASGARPAPPGEVLRARLPRAGRRGGHASRGRRSRNKEVMEFHDGDRIALVGQGAAAAARWLLGQLATHQGAVVHGADALLTPIGPGRHQGAAADEERWQVVVSDGLAPAPGRSAGGRRRHGGTVHLTVADSLDAVPHWCTRVVPVQDCRLGVPWLTAVLGLGAEPEDEGGQLPAQVTLEELLGPADRIGEAWGREPGLRAALGVGRGMGDLDLAAHGPHALVAGTTGSGKSELLLAWMLGLAAGHSPADLQLVLIDYKGGATFGRLAGLPHTAGVLTDLEPASTVRAVQSLQAEVRRRERELARAGVKDLPAYRALRAGDPRHDHATAMPRLVVVVDEFRELAESHAEILQALVRLAAQGRSLGIHLVLATQRPGGSVSGEIRANLTVRICLRVLEAAESQDVVGVADAARLPRVPGRALLRVDGAASEVQAAWCGEGQWVEEAIAAANSAWQRQGLGPPPRPWAPELPRHIRSAEVTRHAGADLAADSGIPLGLGDLTGDQRLAPYRWMPGGLLVLGGPRSGRTTALRTLALGALRQEIAVHVLAADPSQFHDLRAPRLGTVTGSNDPRRAARLLEILHSDPTEALLVVDDAETVAEDLDAVAGAGQGAALLGRALRDGRRAGRHIALAGPPSLAGSRWTEPLRDRLVLAPRSLSEALAAGVPREYAAGAALPGRGVLVEPGICTVLQVAVEDRAELSGPAHPAVPRLLPVPASVPLSAASARTDGRVVIGLGGDAAEPVSVDCSPGSVTLVVGPPGSGRTTVLNTLSRGLPERGRLLHLTPESTHVPRDPVPAPAPATATAGTVVVLDDVERWAPHRLDELAATVGGCPVIAAARTETVASAYRGALAEWRARATLVALSPDTSLKRVVTADLTTAIDPVTRRPGLGIVVAQGRAVPLQVAHA